MNKNRILILYITKVQIYKAQIPGSDSTMQQTNLVNKKIYLSSNLDSVKCIFFYLEISASLKSNLDSFTCSHSCPLSGNISIWEAFKNPKSVKFFTGRLGGSFGSNLSPRFKIRREIHNKCFLFRQVLFELIRENCCVMREI